MKKSGVERPGVPEEVLEIAHKVMAHMGAFGIEETTERKRLARRLLEDARMLSVWKRILLPHPKHGYAHPVRPEALNPFSASMLDHFRREIELLDRVGDEALVKEGRWLAEQIRLCEQSGPLFEYNIRQLTPRQRQGWACRSIYMGAFSAGAHDRSVVTAAEIQNSANAKLTVAFLLNESATLASKLLGKKVNINVEEPVAMLKKEASLELLRKGDELLVNRQRGDASLRGLVLRLHGKMLDHFGTHLYGQIATIANVVLDRDDITQSRIREMLRP